MKVLITGGTGFVGSHAAEFFVNEGYDVVIFDNLMRARILGKKEASTSYNLKYLRERYRKIRFINGDIRNFKQIRKICKDVDIIIHTAAQTAVTSSLQNPRLDFEINTVGTFNVLEAARLSKKRPTLVFCSTNKVYGNNVNKIKVIEKEKRYVFADKRFEYGIPESFSIDLCEHTPYGASKLAADIYVQDYAERNEINAAVFRMSCIYGTRQFGVEDQGWVAWFCIATMLGKQITIYGDGKQVRDVLYVDDLINAFHRFIEKAAKIEHAVYNMGGGRENTISLLELLDMLEKMSGKKPNISFGDWRAADQKVYISDIRKAMKELKWKPRIKPKEGVKRLLEWVEENKRIFQ